MPNNIINLIKNIDNNQIISKNKEGICRLFTPLFFMFFIILLCALQVDAATIISSSCSRSDVQTAVDSSSSGDTVLIPSGECTWTSGVTISNKSITIQGAGIGNTIINGSNATPFRIDGNSSRVTAIEFNMSSSDVSAVSCVSVPASQQGWRVDHCEIDYRSATGKGTCVNCSGTNRYYPEYELKGLIDNNDFYDCRLGATGSATVNAGGGNGAAFWIMAAPTDLGGPRAVYMEDNNYYINESGNLVDSGYGGEYVWRFNTVTRGTASGATVEAHSIQAIMRANKKIEVYGNSVYAESTWAPMLLRGGTGIIFDNSFTGSWGASNILLDNRRDSENIGPGLCNGTCNWDGNESGQSGWPCRDQPGRGADASYWPGNNNPPFPDQELAPMYMFHNTIRGSNLAVSVQAGSTDHIQANRDYYDYVTGFNGTSGVGRGTKASMPATCTTGVGYWVTDEGEWNSNNPGNDGRLYKCSSTNTWEVYYTPYTYPHPLRGEGETVPPGAPLDLQAVE